MAQPIQAVQVYYEHPFGAEREVLKTLFLYALYTKKTICQSNHRSEVAYSETVTAVNSKTIVVFILR